MKKLHFKTIINTPADKVFTTLTNLETYKQWTAVFDPSCSYEGSWDKGSKIIFTAFDKDGKRGGMVSEIADNVTNRFISIRHLGILDGYKEIVEGPEVEKFAGALENYLFEENNGITTLSIELDTVEEYVPYFTETFPKALEKLKAICEE